ncbi:MAG TPA: benzoate transporter, partial [Micromonosporaceae bacterium]|nr:benzoate transporter [Micromonosporaceae bacterium]
PDTFSGSSLVTLLSFDLGKGSLGEGDPTALFADGDTVYGSGPNLYIAHDQRWRGWRGPEVWGGDVTLKDVTEVFQFDVTAPKPAYVAGGSFPGWLLNQYSLSEHDGVLRAATTNTAPWQSPEKSSSTVYALRRDGGTLKQIGSVGGLGKGERIYAVRFVGPVGFVVTYRQVDPLYTINLCDPRNPKIVGELKIPGYSAYLHPVSSSRLIGVGQDATEQGRVTGTQISLFDVG